MTEYNQSCKNRTETKKDLYNGYSIKRIHATLINNEPKLEMGIDQDKQDNSSRYYI